MKNKGNKTMNSKITKQELKEALENTTNELKARNIQMNNLEHEMGELSSELERLKVIEDRYVRMKAAFIHIMPLI